jgi:hypothetical protein
MVAAFDRPPFDGPSLSKWPPVDRPGDGSTEDAVTPTAAGAHYTKEAGVKYMMMVKADKDYEAGRPPRPELIAAIGALSEEARKSGKLLASEGLKPSSVGTRIRLASGKRVVTDGPFAETKELIGGFAIFEVASRQEALELAQRLVDAHVNVGVTDFEMEMRPLYGPEDFGRCG